MSNMFFLYLLVLFLLQNYWSVAK